MKDQRRGARIAMGPEERDAFLAEERTCRVATVGAEGGPHVTPLWFVWDGAALWLTSIVRSERWVDLQRDGRVAVVVDAGTDFTELRGVEITGRVTTVGEVPRTGEDVAELEVPERLFADKYAGGQVFHDGRHAWLKIVPDKLVSRTSARWADEGVDPRQAFLWASRPACSMSRSSRSRGAGVACAFGTQ